MTSVNHSANCSRVALRKESVDRNQGVKVGAGRGHGSLSARRAWIEIAAWCQTPAQWRRRSPQGERG